jgi:hypothetical protein
MNPPRKPGRPRNPPQLHPDSRLTYLRDDPGNPLYTWCSCSCRGANVRVRRDRLGTTLSCGCVQRERATTTLTKSRGKRWAKSK